MTLPNAPAALPALASLREQIAALADGEPREVRAGHLDLGSDLWLSCDPAGRARMRLESRDGGSLGLEVAEADSGRWACLGMRLQAAELAQARRAGLRLALYSGGVLSCRLALRFFLPEGGFEECHTPAPGLVPPGPQEVLLHVASDPELAARATGCELNLFFLDDSLHTEGLQLEPLLML
ncbi:hypothetical protein [Leisingera sp. ANG59]|uniref:hypothetical protein n=1 Tax=Leisingera sp. ANG59 TaxID=2675221 RepID=UPI00157321EB|nr:hypothetical protein [Leisingera sp. ANG59]NSY39544.1 hypothetical protein [Leisingera sp. ANG59]